MKRRRSTTDYPKKSFDLITWVVPTLGFVMFVYAMAFVAIYTIRVGGPNVGLYVDAEDTTRPVAPNTDVGELLKGISEAFDPNKK